MDMYRGRYLTLHLAHLRKVLFHLLQFDDIFEEYYAAGQRLKEFVTDTSKILDDAFVAEPTPVPTVTLPAIGLLDVTNGYVPWSISNITPCAPSKSTL
jgi:adenylosuccinate synthase